MRSQTSLATVRTHLAGASVGTQLAGIPAGALRLPPRKDRAEDIGLQMPSSWSAACADSGAWPNEMLRCSFGEIQLPTDTLIH